MDQETEKAGEPNGCVRVEAMVRRFEACCLTPNGWVVLSPWIKTMDGFDYRHIIQTFGWGGDKDKAWAEHMAKQLNGDA